jgi:Flp pilus assembly protein TadD
LPAEKSSTDSGAISHSQLAPAERYYALLLKMPGEGPLFERWLRSVGDGDEVWNLWLARLKNDGDSQEARTAWGASVVFGRVLALRGDAPGARAALARARARFPGDAAAYLVEANLLQGDAAAQRSLLESAIAHVDPRGREEILRRLGALCLELGDIEGASAYARELGQLTKAEAKVSLELVAELERRGHPLEAKKELERLARVAGLSAHERANVLRELGVLEMAHGRPAEALERLREAERWARPDQGLWLEVLELELDASRRLGSLAALGDRFEKEESYKAWVLAARAFQEVGEAARAERLFERILGKAPADRQMIREYALFLEQAGRVADATTEYSRLLELEPKNTALAVRVIELWVIQGDLPKARSILERLARGAQSSAERRFVLDTCDRIFLTASCEGFEKRFAADASAELLFELGERKFDRGQTAEALALWKRGSTLEPGSAGQIRYAEVLLGHGQFRLAFEVYERLALREPRNLELVRARALGLERILTEADRDLSASASKAATEAFLELLSLVPKTSERALAARHLVQLWQRASRLDQEVLYWKKRSELHPEDVVAWVVLSEAYALRGEGELMRGALAALAQASPGDPWAELRLLRVERGQRSSTGGPQGARVARQDLNYSLELASLLRRSGQIAQAREVLSAMLPKFPESPELHLALGQLLVLSGDNQGAIEHFQAVLAAEPERRDVALPLAELWALLGERERAARLFLGVARGNPRSDEASRAALGLRGIAERAPASEGAVLALQLETALLDLFRTHPEDVDFASELVSFYEWCFGDPDQSLFARRIIDAQSRKQFVNHSLLPLSAVLAKADSGNATRAVRLLVRGGAELAAPILLNYATTAGPTLPRAEAMLGLRATNHRPTWTALGRLFAVPDSLSPEVAWCGLYSLIASDAPNVGTAIASGLDSTRPELRGLAYLGGARHAQKLRWPRRLDAGEFENLAWGLAVAFSADPDAPKELLDAAKGAAPGQVAPLLVGLALAARQRKSSWLELPGALELAVRELLEGGRSSELTLRALDETALEHLERVLRAWGPFELEPRADLPSALASGLLGTPPRALEPQVFEQLLGSYAARLQLRLAAGGAAARASLELLDPKSTDAVRPPTAELRQAIWRLIQPAHLQFMSDDPSAWGGALRALPSEALFDAGYQALLIGALDKRQSAEEPAGLGPEPSARERVVMRLLAEARVSGKLLWAAYQSEPNPVIRERLLEVARRQPSTDLDVQALLARAGAERAPVKGAQLERAR